MYEKGIRKYGLCVANKKISDGWESEQNQEKSTLFFNKASSSLFEAYKELHDASLSIPKNDFFAEYEVVAVILKLDDPIMYYRNYYGFKFMYKFKTKRIENKWKGETRIFTNYSKKLIEYEKILKRRGLK
ncbi:hypothetical protein GMJAKD_02605 [Candidatus Electrothrix aarhusensis]